MSYGFILPSHLLIELVLIQIVKYFAYGSNLNREDLAQWCNTKNCTIPELRNPNIFRLENYVVGFTRKSTSRDGGVADIIHSNGDFCYGIVFDVTEKELKIIDEKEGVKYGVYRRFNITDSMISYEVVKKTAFVKPSSKYVDLIIEGARHYGLPHSWIEKLESFKQNRPI